MAANITRKLDENAFREFGIPAWLIRGKSCIGESRDVAAGVDAIVSGLPVNFTRRNYGKGQFFCWVEVWHAATRGHAQRPRETSWSRPLPSSLASNRPQTNRVGNHDKQTHHIVA